VLVGFRLLIEGAFSDVDGPAILGREVNGTSDGVGDTGIDEVLVLTDDRVLVTSLLGILLSLVTITFPTANRKGHL
jgi:hypothetical protein